MKKFNELIGNEKILRGVKEMGYENPTEIQEKAIPFVLEGRDIIAKSNTGTGKTASFGLPLLEMIYEGEIEQVLIVCPTRELAIQVEGELRKYSKYTDSIKIASVYGGTPIHNQIRAIKKGVKVIVGTPGRILDHVKRKTIKLKNYDCVVLDEADEMLNMGFREDIEKILDNIEIEHQTILFSATMPKPIREIAKNYLNDPVEIEVKQQYKTVDTVEQVYYQVKGHGQKVVTIKKILEYYSSKLSVIFCNRKANVDEVVDELNKAGVKAMGIHGDIRQDKRTRIMASFKKADEAILVASDVAARGIDVNNIDLVLNYDLPQDNEVYVHRIGRTGRAGKNGLAVTLVQGKRQLQRINEIIDFTKADIKRKELPTEKDIRGKKDSALLEKWKSTMDYNIPSQLHKELINEMLSKGYTYENMISALFHMLEGKKTKTKIEDGIELVLDLGQDKKETKSQIKETIMVQCTVKEDQIGAIKIRKNFATVLVEKKVAKKIINKMSHSKNKWWNVRFYNK